MSVMRSQFEADADALEKQLLESMKTPEQPEQKPIEQTKVEPVAQVQESVTEEVKTPEAPKQDVKQGVAESTPSPWEERYKTLQGINKQTAHENAQLRAEIGSLRSDLDKLKANQIQAQPKHTVADDEVDKEVLETLGGKEVVNAVRKLIKSGDFAQIQQKIQSLESENESLKKQVQNTSVISADANAAIQEAFKRSIEAAIPNYWDLDKDGTDFDSFIKENTDLSGVSYNAILQAAFERRDVKPFKAIYDIYANKMGLNKPKVNKDKLTEKVSLSAVKSNNNNEMVKAPVKQYTWADHDQMSEQLLKGRITRSAFNEWEKGFNAALEAGQIS